MTMKAKICPRCGKTFKTKFKNCRACSEELRKRLLKRQFRVEPGTLRIVIVED